MARPLALLLIVLLGLLVPAQPAAAQNIGCDLASMLPMSNTVRAFLGAPWTDERPVPVGVVTLMVRMCTPMEESATGADMLQLTVDVLPILDELTDVPLRGSLARTIVMINSKEVYNLGADGFIDQNDVIHLHPRSLPSTVVHEAAHYWASRENFSDPWLVEAYAEYLTALAMNRLGRTYQGHDDRNLCADVALLNWSPTLEGREVCAYSVGPQVLRDLANTVGDDTMRQVLGELSLRQRGIESRGLLVALEAASGKDLTGLMRGRVFPPEYDQILARRSAARARFAEATSLASGLGLSPPPAITLLIDAWILPDAEAALDALIPLLTQASATAQRCAELQLPCVQPWRELGEDPERWRTLTGELAQSASLLDAYARLRDQSVALAVGIPQNLQAAATSLNSAALPSLQEASDTLSSAQALEQRCMAFANLACRPFWIASWDAGDQASAHLHIRKLDRFLSFAAALNDRCGVSAAACQVLWQQTLTQDGLDAAPQTIKDISGLLDRAEQAEQDCAQASWPCSTLWRTHLERGDRMAALTQLEALTQALPTLVQLEHQLDELSEPATILETLLPADMRPATRLAAARQAFAEGEFARARSLAEAAVQQRLTLRQGVRWGGVILGLAGIVIAAVGVSVALSRRQRRKRIAPRSTALGASGASTPAAPLSSGQAAPPTGMGIAPSTPAASAPATDLLEELLRDPLNPPI